ncbi:hypothetical protein O6H91_01G153900 [Diphasiastrum complanatum]|uniref:Uncharacterized protein n=1 Tax=Diphasiastrum complanatum TaxID=34168 RepID=A0ACC2EXI2_DIPCM|nr:hypothetical protein O6H91_01G153900 [Diphasiastrum complanatum]
MTWLIDGRKLAKKIKNAVQHSSEANQQVNPCSECPSCGYVFGGNDAAQVWPGLPAGVKFDPTDKEILDHLAAKIGVEQLKAHAFIDEFIPTLSDEEGICYTHPEKLPGVKRDGTCSHFFHQPTNAYTTGTRKRRKIQSGNDEFRADTRWHKTGRTRPIFENGNQIGYKKIMVLYSNFAKSSKPDKTSWIMHQYHLGSNEDEKEGEFVVSKVFYQTQPRQFAAGRKDDAVQDEISERFTDDALEEKVMHPQAGISESAEAFEAYSTKGMPVTPKLYTPFRPQRDKDPLMDSIATSFIEQMVPLTLHLDKTENLKTCQPNASEPDFTNGDALNIHLDNDNKDGTGRNCGWKDEGLTSNCTLSGLFCEEKLDFNPSPSSCSVLDAAQEFLNLAADSGLPFHEFYNDGFYTMQKSSLDDVDLDTPPDFLEDDLVLNSQDSLEWLGKRNSPKQ